MLKYLDEWLVLDPDTYIKEPRVGLERNSERTVLTLVVFILPYLLLKSHLVEPHIARLFADNVVDTLLVPYMLYKSLSKKMKLIPRWTKLNKPGFEKAKERVRMLIRVSLFVGSFIFAYMDAIAWREAYDILVTKTAKFEVVEAKPVDPSALFGVAFFYSQSAIIDKKGYSYSYSFAGHLRANTKYRFIIMPKSRKILDAQPLE